MVVISPAVNADHVWHVILNATAEKRGGQGTITSGAICWISGNIFTGLFQHYYLQFFFFCLNLKEKWMCSKYILGESCNDNSIKICETLTDFFVMIWYDDTWLHTLLTLLCSCNLKDWFSNLEAFLILFVVPSSTELTFINRVCCC